MSYDQLALYLICGRCVPIVFSYLIPSDNTLTSLFIMKSAAYRWYKDITKENVHIQSLEFCKSLKLDLNEFEINIDLNLNINILINISKEVCT